MIRGTFVALIVTTMMLTVTQHTTAQATLVSNSTLSTLERTWTLLGTRTIDNTVDRDVIVLADSGNHFTSLKFTVLNGTLDMQKFTIHFIDGETKDVDFSSKENTTNEGQVFKLEDDDKSIEKVTFWYNKNNTTPDIKSVVELWGNK